jgi:hypothetical protein
MEGWSGKCENEGSLNGACLVVKAKTMVRGNGLMAILERSMCGQCYNNIIINFTIHSEPNLPLTL